ncbi:aminoglycoside phosphotransferase family protein [Methylophaga lonarensis]|uniref:aminoglycoside phosphotransferase family protein n=1 Tax=Methylophaga lonarensis TaxID=999151 RepID=UPI003D2809A2
MVDFNRSPYSFLSEQQQATLPDFNKAVRLMSPYEDSTNSTWLLETDSGRLVLKLCDLQWVEESTFWTGMRLLFDLHLPVQMQKFDLVYGFINQHSPLSIPALLAAGASCHEGMYPGYVMAEALAGKALTNDAVTDASVRDLARHLASLHAQQQSQWGSLASPDFTAELWPVRLRDSMLSLASKQNFVAKELLDAMTQQALLCRPAVFSPIMPDLRWDQFLMHEGQLAALVDLDAFVWGPVEMEFVLLEYLLTADQWRIFTEQYQQYCPLPVLDIVRAPYRMMLFLMNVLGEKDVQKWMHAPHYL